MVLEAVVSGTLCQDQTLIRPVLKSERSIQFQGRIGIRITMLPLQPLAESCCALRETAPVTVATGSSFEGPGLGVTLDAAQSPAFAEKVGAMKNNNVQGNRFVAVSVTTGAIEIKSGLLTIWDHGKVILQTTAAAYRPKPQ
jgi:hypothetical protein